MAGVDQGAEDRIHLRAALDGGVHEFGRMHVAPPDPLGQRDGVVIPQRVVAEGVQASAGRAAGWGEGHAAHLRGGPAVRGLVRYPSLKMRFTASSSSFPHATLSTT